MSFYIPQNFINRELSWLEFNRRVLEEAQDARQPLMERIKFMSIFSSNLDEFFEIRVAGIKQQMESQTSESGVDGLSPAEVLLEIQRKVHELVEVQYQLWNQELTPLLVREGIRFCQMSALSEKDLAWGRKFFLEQVFPALTPLAVDASHPFPQLLNKSLNLIVRVRRQIADDETLLVMVQIPRVLPQWIRIPRTKSEVSKWDVIYLEDLIRYFVGELFPNLKILSAHTFRVTRNSDLYIDEDAADNILLTIENELRRRHRGNAVRLEVQADCPLDVRQYLMETFALKEEDVYVLTGPLSFLNLMSLSGDDAFAHLRDRPFQPTVNQALSQYADPFEVLRRQDVLLHHPYESFDSVVDLIERAAGDPAVLAIKMTLYRTSGDSPVIRALMDAALQGKQVMALVELKARFDEANNIQWAKQMEEAGVHVVYGVVGLKVHCKALLIVRRDEDRIRLYAHLGTGNYHPRTARIYTDFSLLTAKPEITQEVQILFNTLTGLTEYPGFKQLMVAPFDMKERFLKLVQREREYAKAGKKARMIVKMNSLVDEDSICALYEASCAGVEIDLIIRGICCLRPGIKGVSENIRVTSIVGRFLEHSRVVYFANDGQPEIYLGSADWMPRNFERRVEMAFPLLSLFLKKHMIEDILPAYLNDCVKARRLQPDGTYQRVQCTGEEAAFAAQLHFREIARCQTAYVKQRKRKSSRRLTPVRRKGKIVNNEQ